MLKRAPTILAVVLVMAACAQPTSQLSDSCRKMLEAINQMATPNYTLATVEGIDTRPECGQTNLRITGDFDAKIQNKDLVVGATTNLGGKVPAAATFFGLAMADFIELPSGVRFRVSFNVAPGLFKGKGDYALGNAEKIEGQELKNPIDSNVLLEIVAGKSAAEGQEPYVVFERPADVNCELEVLDDKGSSGTLDCPVITTADRKAALVWTWKNNPID